MPSEARQKKIMEKLNRAQKCSILGPQNLGSGGARAPGVPPGSAPDKGHHFPLLIFPDQSTSIICYAQDQQWRI